MAGGKANLFGVRKPGAEYSWMTWDEGEARALAIATSLRRMGVRPGTDFVGIMLHNCPEWYITDIACMAAGYANVPLYVTGDEGGIIHIIRNLCDVSIVFCGEPNAARLVRLKAEDKIPTLNKLVLIGFRPDDKLKAAAASAGVSLFTFDDLLAEGSKGTLPPSPTKDEYAPMSIVSTSGTTGNPKGAVLSQRCFAFSVQTIIDDLGWKFTPGENSFSYLPTAHIGDRIISWAFVSAGMGLAFATGVQTELFSDMQAAKPVALLMVPRILNRLVGVVRNMVDAQGPEFKRKFDEGFRAKRKLMIEQGIISRDTEWDRAIFGKLQAVLGGKMRYITAGAAAVDVNSLEFCRIVFGVQMCEVFGQTEGTGLATNTSVNDPRTPYGSHVGRPYQFMDVVLRDVPELGYSTSSNPPRGEVLVRGPNVMTEYLREPGKTKETIDEQGYLAMGDVAEMLPDGTIRIIDRAKNVFKMSQGEFVAPERIEAIIMRSPWVAQAFVYGELQARWLVAVVCPDPERAAAWAKERGKPADLPSLCRDEDLRRTVQEDVIAVGKANGLLGYEIPKAITLFPGGFTVEEGLITPSLKNKRNALKDKFDTDLKGLYASIKDN
ncbi:hypothetical protein DFJ74DRAFT_609441 [Hyaloraphidium curvatum]|nr:hypothetical protein DFJ74DRAFT_609441 [Hyaloraphidium curvatum]